MSLDQLTEPRTYAPKGFFLGVWVVTTAIGIAGLLIALLAGASWWFWVVVLLIGLRQLWVTRWVQVDSEGIRTRNIFGRGRSLPWQGVTAVDEKTFPMRKEKFFSIISLEGTSDLRGGTKETIRVDSDINGFDTLRRIILEMAPAE